MLIEIKDAGKKLFLINTEKIIKIEIGEINCDVYLIEEKMKTITSKEYKRMIGIIRKYEFVVQI